MESVSDCIGCTSYDCRGLDDCDQCIFPSFAIRQVVGKNAGNVDC